MLRAVLTLGLSAIILILAAPSMRAQIDAGAGREPTVYILHNIDRAEQRSSIAAIGVDIIEVGKDYIIIEARPDQIDRIQQLGFTPELMPAPLAPTTIDPAYHTYDQMVADIQSYAITYTNIMKLITIGLSYQGRSIWVAKITNNPESDENKPEVLFTFQQHAREHLTVEQGLYILHLLTDNYTHDMSITNLVNTRVVWLIFDLNPDGGEYDISGGSYHMWRKNCDPQCDYNWLGTDLNRNWDYQWGSDDIGSSSNPADETYRGAAAFSEPETKVVSDFVASRVISGQQRIKVAIDFHTYSELVLWPYGYTSTDVPADMTQIDHDIFVAMGTAMANMNGYTPEQASDLYLTNGTIDDWLYGVYHIYAFTFEMYPAGYWDGGFYPPGSVIDTQTARNRDPILYAIDLADDPSRSINLVDYYFPIVGR